MSFERELIPGSKAGGRQERSGDMGSDQRDFLCFGGGRSMASITRRFSGEASGIHLFSQLAQRRDMVADARPSAGVDENRTEPTFESHARHH